VEQLDNMLTVIANFIDSGEMVPPANLPKNGHIRFFAEWSPDGQRLASTLTQESDSNYGF